MPKKQSDIYATRPLRRLLDDQLRGLTTKLQRCSGPQALMIGVSPAQIPPALPMLRHWAHLYANDSGFFGDVRAALDEPLPFLDESFEVVLLQHALEVVPHPQNLMAEALRLLAPGGTMVFSGIHPLSPWAPWLYWNARDRRLRLQWPLQLKKSLSRMDLQFESLQRVGDFWPSAHGEERNTMPFGGGYVLISRKSRSTVTPLRLKPVGLHVRANGGALSPGTRRDILTPMERTEKQ